MALPSREMKYEDCILYSLTLSLISPCNDETQAWVCSLQPSHGQGQVASDSDVRSSDICTETRRASNTTNTITIPRHSETIRITDISTAPLLLLPRQEREAAFNMLSYIRVLCDSFEYTKSWS